MAYEYSQARGRIGATATGLHSHNNVGSKLSLRPYTMAHGSAGSLAHWAGPRMKPASLCILVGFVTTEPQRELQDPCLYPYSSVFARMTYKWNPVVCRIWLWLGSFRIKDVFEIHPSCFVYHSLICFYCSVVFQCMAVLEIISPFFLSFFLFFLSFVFLGSHLQHMEVPRLWVESEL